MTSKTCFKCSVEKPLSEFYKHKGMKDGHFNKCKSCSLKDDREYQEKTDNVKPRLERFTKKDFRLTNTSFIEDSFDPYE